MNSFSVSATATSAPLDFPTTLASIDISIFFPTKMDRTCYFSWRSQFISVLTIHDLSFVLQSDFLPPPENSVEHRLTPDFITRRKFDSLVFCWIRATVTPAIQQLLLPCNSAYEAWSLLENRLSRFNVLVLRHALRHLQKTPAKSMFDFLIEAKGVSDTLAAAGSPVPEHDLVNFIIDGLTADYEDFITDIDLRQPPSFDELYDLLLQEEAEILQNRAIPASVLPTEACLICFDPDHSALVCPQRENITDDTYHLIENFQTMSLGDSAGDL